MTMRKISFIAALVVAMTAVSCVKEMQTETPAPEVNGAVTFEASFGAATKASLELGETESKVAWDAGDQVGVFAGEGNYLYAAESAGYSTKLLTEATDVPAEGPYYAVYPYDAEAVLAEGVITTTLPAVQTAVLGSFTTHLSVAQAVENKFAFKNVCGLVGVKIDAENVTKIVLEGNNGEIVAGAINVTVADAPAWTAVAEQGATSVTLAPAEGTLAKGVYYFAVLPQTFEKGFNVKAYKGDDAYVLRNVSAEYELKRSDIVGSKAFGIEGEGTEASPYILETPQDMVDMRSLTKLGGEVWFKLNNDINMEGVDNYLSLNNVPAEKFNRKIHFDGNNKTISNFTCNQGEYPSLFGVLYGSVKDLTVTNAVIDGSNKVCGILAGYVGTLQDVDGDGNDDELSATVTNVSVQGTVSNTSGRAGGFCGNSVFAEFTDCDADVTVSSNGSDVGGFVGKSQQTVKFTRCNVKANVSSSAAEKNRTAGFVGYLQTTTSSFDDCHVLEGSKVTDNSAKTASTVGFYGGLIAYDGSTVSNTITKCTVDADINTANCQSVGGLVGNVGGGGDITIDQSNFEGSISGTNQLAGLIAYTEKAKNITVTNSHSEAIITGGNTTGSHYCVGLIGYAKVSQNITMTGCHSAGSITSGGSSNAGLIGAVDSGVVTVEDSYSTADVTGNNNVGGLFGNMAASATIKSSYYAGAKLSANQTVGGIVGNSKFTSMTDCYVHTEMTTKGKSIGGLIGSQTPNISISGCHFSGSIVAAEQNVGGLVGYAISGQVTMTKSYSTGSITLSVNKNNVGGLLGYLSKFTLTDSWSSMDVTSGGQAIGGIVGMMSAPSTIRNCYATGDVTGRASTGGIVGMTYNNADGNDIQNSVFWGTVTNTKTSSAQYAAGAIIGCVNTNKITAKNCWRGADVTLSDYSGDYKDGSGKVVAQYSNPLVDHDDFENSLPPYLSCITSTTYNAFAQRPYHGKAAAADATISSVAKTLGWSEDIWNFSGDVPVLK